MGRPDINTKLMFVTILLYMPAYYIAAQFGLEIFLYVRLSLVFVGIAIQVYVFQRILNVSSFYLWHDGKSFILAAIAMGAGLGTIKWAFQSIAPVPPQVLELALLIIMGVGIYGVTLWLLDRSFILDTFRLIRQAALT
jgi:hypothetical protein